MSTLVTRPPSCVLTHYQPSRDDGAGAAGGSLHATLELWSLPALTAAAAFPVTSTVKANDRSSLGGSSGAGGGRIDLITTFGSFVACTFSDSNRLAIYSLSTHAKHNQSTMPERARCITADASGRYLVMGSATGWLRIYTLATGSLLRQMRTHHDRGINCVSIDHESQFLVLAGEDGVISVYDFARIIQVGAAAAATQQQAQGLQQSALLLSISDHSLAITSLHISASKYLLSSSKDGSVRVYKLEQPMAGAASSAASSSSSQSAPAPPCLFHHSFRAMVSAAVMDVSESIIYAACKENIHWVSLYPSSLSGGGRMGAAPTVHTWRGHQSSVMSLLLPPSSSTLLSVDAEGFLKLWDAGSPCGAAPPAQGNVIKNLGRRAGCRNLRYVDAADLGAAAGAVATANTYLAAHAPKSGGGGSSTGLQGKDSGWVFPPLNAGLPSPIAFVSVPLVPMAIQNQELNSIVREKSRARRFGSLYTSGSDGGAEEQSIVCDAASRGGKHARADWELLTGLSGWSSLAESASNRGSTLEALQNEVEALGANVSDMYKLAVEKIWKDIKTAPDTNGATANAASAAKAMR